MDAADEYHSSDDEDYVPDVQEEDVDEPSGDECPEVTAEGDEVIQGKRNSRKKTKKDDKPKTVELSESTKEDVDSIFAALIAEDAYASTSSIDTQTKEDKRDTVPRIEAKPATKVVSQVYDFAGEEVKITKEVSLEEATKIEEKEKEKETGKKPAVKRTGIGAALTMLSKKPKMSVLDKSNLDWQEFKSEEKIEEDLTGYNKGKGGYLHKQDFLNRADHAQFEREKAVRDSIRRQNM